VVVVGGILGDSAEIVVGKERVDFVVAVLGVCNYFSCACRLWRSPKTLSYICVHLCTVMNDL